MGGLFWSGRESDFLAGEVFELAGQVALARRALIFDW